MSPELSRTLLAALLLCAGTLTSAAADVTLPPRKPGLWLITMTRVGMPGAMPESRMCIDSATDAQMMQAGLSAARDMCDPPNIAGTGNVRTIDTVCRLGGSTQTSHVVLTYSGESAYHMAMSSRYEPAFYGQTSSEMTQDATWAGACPADMQPGDIVTNGMKINILSGFPIPK